MNQPAASSNAAMLLIFRLAEETFALPVESVHEILDPQDPTPVPNADPFSPGLINVRGVVVPVIDVRRRLGMAPASVTETARMIVLEYEIEGTSTKLAFSADAVEEVTEAELSRLEKVPDLGANWPQACLRGAFKLKDDLIVLLDNETLFAPSYGVAQMT